MKPTKPETVFEKYEAIQKIGTQVEVPWDVWRHFGTQQKFIEVEGQNVFLGEDCGSLEEVRAAVEYYVTQLGGAVTWKPKA